MADVLPDRGLPESVGILARPWLGVQAHRGCTTTPRR